MSLLQGLHLKCPLFGKAALITIFVLGSVALALANDSGAKGVCILESEGACVLKALYPQLRLVQKDGETEMLAILTQDTIEDVTKATRAPNNAKGSDSLVLNIGEDLKSRTSSGEMTVSDATWIEGELRQSDGVSYSLPSLDELKQELGFPEETTFVPEDYRDIIVVHIQTSMGLSPLTAEYLAERMGIHSQTLPEHLPEVVNPRSAPPTSPIEHPVTTANRN